MEKEVISQSVMQQGFLPMLREEGKLYCKMLQVLARKAVAGERINTITQDGLETTNVADADAFQTFVLKSEQILSTENSNWGAIFRRRDDGGANGSSQIPKLDM